MKFTNASQYHLGYEMLFFCYKKYAATPSVPLLQLNDYAHSF